MASQILTLDGTTWVDIGTSGVIIDVDGAIQILNSDSAPTGGHPEGIYIKSNIPFVYLAPASGNLYLSGVGTAKFYEV